MLAMMGSANVETLKGQTVGFGIAVGVVVLALMVVVKVFEVRRQRS
jgi:heme/copper-type cytochrome/quinol oxidase subunit 4